MAKVHWLLLTAGCWLGLSASISVAETGENWPPQSGVVPGYPCAAPCVEKICIPVPDKKVVTKTVYGCKSVDFCLPKCPSLLGGRCHGAGCTEGCAPSCVACEKIRTRKVLMKRTVRTAIETFKCVPEAICLPCPAR